MTVLDERHRVRQDALRTLVGDRLARALGRIDTLDQAAVDAYHGYALPTVLGGQSQAASLGAAYTASRSRRRDLTGLDVAGALQRSGVLVTAETPSLVAPVLRAARLVNEGQALGAALVAAGNYARLLSSADLLVAQRVGQSEGAGGGVRGWRHDPAPNACEWCQQLGAEGTVYADADSVPFHTNDRCSVVPVLAGDE